MNEDDDRETLAALIRDIYRKHGYYTSDQVVADALIAAGIGFRRSEVEPTDEEVDAALNSWAAGDFRSMHPRSVPFWEPRMRAALRAASEVRGAR